MSKLENTHKMPLYQRFLAVAMSAVLAVSLCPITEALADTNSKASNSSESASTQQSEQATSSEADIQSSNDEAALASVQSDSSNEKNIDTKNTWNEAGSKGTLGDGSLEFVLCEGDSPISGVWASGKSFGSVDYGKSGNLKLKIYRGADRSEGALVFDSKKLTSGFTVTGLNEKSVGEKTVKVTATSASAYTGEVELKYTVNSKPISSCKIEADFINGGYYAYTGSAIKAKLKITDTTKKVNGKEYVLKEGTDYKLIYENNVSGETAYVYAEGIAGSDYDDSTSKHKFHIVGLKYNSYGQGSWKGWVNQGSTSGKGSGTKKVGRMEIDRINSALSGTVSYTMYNDKKATSGSNTKKGKYTAAGIAGQAAQYMSVSLSGELSKHFDVYYRTYISGAGWMAWAKNGAKAGVKNFNARMKMCGYQIKLVEKSGGSKPANGDLYTSFESNWDSFAKDILYSRIKNMSSSTSYCITVDTTFNRVAIYTGSKGKWKLKKYWKCGTGIKSRPTTKGDFKLKSYKRARIDSGKISYWNFHGYGGSLGFHSALTKRGSRTKFSKPLSKQLGNNISHGCVRLLPANAKYVYNMPNGTAIRIKGLV